MVSGGITYWYWTENADMLQTDDLLTKYSKVSKMCSLREVKILLFCIYLSIIVRCIVCISLLAVKQMVHRGLWSILNIFNSYNKSNQSKTWLSFISPGGVDGVADGDNISGSSHIQVGPSEGDEARVGHSVLVPTGEGHTSRHKIYVSFIIPSPPLSTSLNIIYSLFAMWILLSQTMLSVKRMLF